jgi:hypothetical protein
MKQQLTFILSLSTADSFHTTSLPVSIQIDAANRARRKDVLYSSFPIHSTTSWHFLPDDVAPEESQYSILHGCDSVLITLDKTDHTLTSHWLRSIDPLTSSQIQEATKDSQSDDDTSRRPPREAIAAIEATHRWASNFVRPLHLCPWAGSSLDTCGAMRYWIILVDHDTSNQSKLAEKWQNVLEVMEQIVRKAGMQIEQITTTTSEDDSKQQMKPIDASVAISFVVLVPTQQSQNVLPDFETFHEYFLDLEDRLLDECDEYWDTVADGEIDETEVPDGCKLTIAAFHPDWKFNNEDESVDDVTDSTSAIDFEKRTPYPTISIVMSSAIDALMDQDVEDDASSAVTNRIAAANEETLCKIGVDKLREMFATEVVCPMNKVEIDD